jgi:hypothetical protein
VPPGTHAYQYVVDGPTEYWFTTVPGSSGTLVATRDRIKTRLGRAGYVEIAQDQELGAEADYYFAGHYIGSVQVRPLCDGRLRVRYGFGAASLAAPSSAYAGGQGSSSAGFIPATAPHGSTSTTMPSCTAIPTPLAQSLTWLPNELSLPPGSYAYADLSVPGGVHAASFVVPGTVQTVHDYVANTWPGQNVTFTFMEEDPTDSEFAFLLSGTQGSLRIGEPYCVPGYTSMTVAYGGS